MPANAAVKLDLDLQTATATRAVDQLKRQLSALQSKAGGVSQAWNRLNGGRQAGLLVGGATAVVDVAASLAPESKLAKSLSSFAHGAKQFGTMLAPLGPQAIAIGAAVGGATSAIKSYVEATRENAKAAAEAAKAEKARGLKHNDQIGEERWAWENADAAGRGKMQADARERLRKARWKLDNDMTITEGDVYGVANWDRSLALELGYKARSQNGGEMPEGLRVLMGQLQGSAFRGIANRSFGGKFYTAYDMAEAADKEGAAGRRIAARGFNARYDRAYAESLEKPEKEKPETMPRVPALPSFGESGRFAGDTLSAMGIGFVGAQNDRRETLDLLRRIADAADRTSRKDGGAVYS